MSKIFPRRKFIAQTTLLGVAISFDRTILKLTQNRPKFKIVLGSKEAAYVFNSTNEILEKIDIPNDPHSFVQDPHNLSRIWAIGKWQKTAIEIDLNLGKVNRVLKAPGRITFGGHGVFSPNGDHLWMTGNDFTTRQGRLLCYERNTLSLKAELAIGYGALHDCHFIGNQLIGTTTTGTIDFFRAIEGWNKSCLVFVDTINGKIVDKKSIDDRDQWLTHFSVLDGEQIIATSIPIPTVRKRAHGEIYLGVLHKDIRRLHFPEQIRSQLKDEFLSIAFDPKLKVAAVTNPQGKNVLFIGVPHGNVVGHVKLHVNGVGLLPDEYGYIFAPFSGQQLFVVKKDLEKTTTLLPTPQSFILNKNKFIFDSGHLLMI